MKLSYLFIAIIFVAGCTPKFQQDMLNNQYFEKTIYADPNAAYIGEWTAATGLSLTAIKINEKGHIKMCSSNPYFGTMNGKIFKENGKIKMIFESGSQYEIFSIHDDHIVVNAYGQDYKYYLGKVPENC